MLFDLSLDQLHSYRGDVPDPDDFDSFWAESLAQARERSMTSATYTPVNTTLRALRVWDVRFPGFAGQPIRGWLLAPRAADGPLPCVVEYVGYGGGRGLPAEWLVWACSGYAHFVMDTRGQGSQWRTGDTPDLGPDGVGPHHPGFMTRGISDPRHYYYRRLIVDAVCAVDAARAHPIVDTSRVAVRGTSQGGGLALAVAALQPELAFAIADVPFLCDFPRATRITDELPYQEIARYLRAHRGAADQVFGTLAYFDGVNFAKRARVPALFSVALMDTICPPSTVYAAYNAYAGDKDIIEWEFNNHESGQIFQINNEIEMLDKQLNKIYY